MLISQDPVSGLWCREDGAVCMPPSRRGGRHAKKYRWTFGHLNKSGYLVICHKRKLYRVHGIIARAFLPNPDNLPTVDHIDRNPARNSVGNLRWADYKTQADNTGKVLNRTDYGVRACEDKKAYLKAYRTANRERLKAHDSAYYAAQKAKGLVYRNCPDGRQHWVPRTP